MAGDWIKWVKGLATRREVLILSAKLGRDRHEIAGRLMTLWEWCDDNLSDSDADASTLNVSLKIGDKPKEFVDALLGLPGMAEAMASTEVKWLEFRSGGLIVFPKLARHNGTSAKTRAYDQQRKQHGKLDRKLSGKNSEQERKHSGKFPEQNRKVSGPEKRREEKREVIPTESCTEPPQASAVPPPVMTIPVSGGGQAEWPVTAEKVAEWSEAYPGVDVLAELRKARQWCIDNPTRRKTLRGVANFCNTWLNKAQNQTRGEPRGLNGTTIRGPAGAAPATAARRSSGTITQDLIDALDARTIRTGTPESDASKTAHTAGQAARSVFGAEEGEAGDQSGVSW